MENSKPNELTLIPKSERYIQYMIEVIIKIPRTEKYSIGTEYKTSMYKMLSSIMYLGKLDDEKKLEYINRIDAELNLQRLFLIFFDFILMIECIIYNVYSKINYKGIL